MVPFNIPTPWCVKSPRKLGNKPPTWASTRRVPCEGHPSTPNLRASGSSRENCNYYYLFILNLDAGSLMNCTLNSEHTAIGTPASPCSRLVHCSWFLCQDLLHPTPPMLIAWCIYCAFFICVCPYRTSQLVPSVCLVVLFHASSHLLSHSLDF